MAIILIYVLFSVSGLLLLKIGTSKAFELSISEGNFSVTVSGVLVVDTCLYLLAFVTSLIAMKNMDLFVCEKHYNRNYHIVPKKIGRR